MGAEAHVAVQDDEGHGPHWQVSPADEDGGLSREKAATSPPEIPPGGDKDSSEGLERGGASADSDFCIPASSDRGSRGGASGGNSGPSSSSPAEQQSPVESPKMDTHAVAGGSHEEEGPIDKDALKPHKNP